jgi:ABC-type transport system involved in multi-copper enzyme maturation permease subunit
MKLVLIKKELNDLLKSKTAALFIILYSSLISYSFYTAVDLYSKASLGASKNPIYATGFEPVLGVFVPTFGGWFMIISLLAPFLFIQSINKEKKYNTIVLLTGLPESLNKILFIKFFSAILFLLILLILILPVFVIWYSAGGYIPITEVLLLITGHLLYAILIVSISFFCSSIFSDSTQASIMALSLIIFSWFLDFAKDMNLNSFVDNILEFSITKQLKYFENGIFSLQSLFYFILLITFFYFLTYLFFNFTIKNKTKLLLIGMILFLLLFLLNNKIHYNIDISQSQRNSFTSNETKFLENISSFQIDIFLSKTDSRLKDYKNDFLKKLKLVKNSTKINYITGNKLTRNYGVFKYTIHDKSETTYSNSSEEIFMVLENLSGLKIDKQKKAPHFKGYPFTAKGTWSSYLFIFYLLILPVSILLFYFKNQLIYIRKRR